MQQKTWWMIEESRRGTPYILKLCFAKQKEALDKWNSLPPQDNATLFLTEMKLDADKKQTGTILAIKGARQ